jgi:hypothetical protein
MKSYSGLAFVVALMVCFGDQDVGAADLEARTPSSGILSSGDGWTFSVAPYFWAAGIRGDIGVRGKGPVGVDIPFRDIFDDLRFGGMVVGEAHNGTWGVLTDLIYLKVDVDRSITGTLGGIPLQLSGNLQTSSLTATFMGEYRAVAQPSVSVDLMAGARVWSVDNDLSLGLAAGGSPIAAFSGSETKTWVDPMIGAKTRVDLSPSWYLTGWAMIGGFGAASDLSWDLLGGLGYQWNKSFSLVAGYRALGVDYHRDGFNFDVVQQGPIFGAVIRF